MQPILTFPFLFPSTQRRKLVMIYSTIKLKYVWFVFLLGLLISFTLSLKFIAWFDNNYFLIRHFLC